MNRTVQRHGKISVVERWIKLSVLMFVETGCKCRIAASSIPSATVQSLNCQCGIPKKHPSSSSSAPNNKRHCHSVCMKNSSFLIPCRPKRWQSMRDKSLQCHLKENRVKRILTGGARLLRWDRHSSLTPDTLGHRH